ncbi:MAG: UPF0280 family protein [Nitrososphaerota archaeon]|nr:UPF0280 family protein [Candidatus Bathyarchaeota archaeon]MDW8022319.1 UPF0280 family protein [Nitrososphaerota archaeon]
MKIKNLFKKNFQLNETNCTIISDSERSINIAISSIKSNRRQLELYLRERPEFEYSLSPVRVENGPRIVRLMAEYAERANVGPMAAVAGVLADLAVEEMLRVGSKVAVVENGGEVSAVSDQPIDVALLAGDHPLSKNLAFRLEDFPMGVATSSGMFSHALSFGEAEAVTIFAVNAGLADAVATAIGNMIKGDDCRRVVKLGVEKATSIQGVRGAIIIYRDFIGIGGYIPKIARIKK